VVVDEGAGIVTEPVGAAHVPTPGIVTTIPVPLLSVVDQDNVTLPPAPLKTEDGFAVKKLMVGAGHGKTVTVTN
jgi:hypothetical protein